jgi:hypothetical protein
MFGAPRPASAQDGPASSGPAAAAGVVAAAEAVAAEEEVRTMIGVAATGLIAQVTGADSANDTAGRWRIFGTDLGHMFWHRGQLYMVFGDTFGKGSRYRAHNWRSNTLARLADPVDLEHQGLRIESMVTNEAGQARELLASRKVDGIEKTVIPTNGISTGDRMFLHYMSVRTWHGGGNWDVGHSGLAYSDDDGQTWKTPHEAIWPGGLGFEQVAFVRKDGYVYSFGIPGGRQGAVRLRRVPAGRMLQPGAHRYWNGTAWVRDPHAAKPVVPGPAGELSVAWNARYGQWMMMYLDQSRHAVLLRMAPKLTGPWGEPQVVVNAQQHPGLYAPYIVPLEDIGSEVWFTLSKWKPYNVFLMRMTLDEIAVQTSR